MFGLTVSLDYGPSVAPFPDLPVPLVGLNSKGQAVAVNLDEFGMGGDCRPNVGRSQVATIAPIKSESRMSAPLRST